MDVTVAPRQRLRRHISLSWTRFLVGLLVGLTGLADMLCVLAPRLRLDLLLDAWPLDLDLESTVRSLAVVVGFLLIMLSRGLMRGKRKAWEMTLLLLVLSAFFHLIRGGWVLATWVTLLDVALFSALRPAFRARSDPPSVLRGYAALGGGLLLVLTYTIGGFILLRSQFDPMLRLRAVAHAAIRTLIGVGMARHIPLTPQASLFVEAVHWLSFSALVFGMAQVLRPVATALLPAPHEREQVKGLIERFGSSTIAYVALSHEKSYFFHRSGQAVLAYRLAGNVAVVAGDPIGPPALLADTLAEFAAFCRQQDWHVVSWQVAQDLLPLYSGRGLQSMKIGEDAVVDLPTFTLKGGAMANLRSMTRHAEKAGLEIRFFEGAVDDPELSGGMEGLAATWLADKGGVEMGFSMGRFGERIDLKTVFAVAVDGTGHVHAFTSFVPVYGRNGWALDLMRRDAGAINGAMELMIVRAIERFAAQGAQVLSLGLAPLANTCDEPSTGIEQLCYLFTSRFGGLAKAESLYNFKRKFHPRWESRYLVYPGTVALPRVGLALAAAHLSHQWLPWARSSSRQKTVALVQPPPVAA